MEIKKKIIVTDWVKNDSFKKNTLKLTLNSDQRKILRGERLSDCNRELLLQLPREGKINDGDILKTNQENIFILVIAKIEKLFQLNAFSKLELLKVSYHLGNRHVEMEISNNYLFVKEDYVIKNLLENLGIKIKKVNKKFFPETGAFSHD